MAPPTDEARTGRAIGQLEQVRALATSGRVLAVGGVRAATASQLVLYDHVGDKPVKVFDVPAHVLALAADDAGFVAACADGALRWYKADGSLEREVRAHAAAATAVAMRGDLVASAGADGAVRTFARRSGAKKKEWSLSSRPLRAIALDPTGEALAGAGDDGVVRVVWFADGRTREMPGHDGAVLCLAFTPADGRLASGGDDGTVRLWYLVGDVEADIRGKDDSGHAGGTHAILFLPAKDAEEIGERFASAGADGKVRVWRTSERRRPRTLETRGNEGLHAAVVTAGHDAGTSGKLFVAGDARTVFAFAFDAQGQLQDERTDFEHGFDVLAADLGAPARTKREAAVRTLCALDEREALDLAVRALESDADAEIRALCASELADKRRRDAKKALRRRLDDAHASVRAAAFSALRALETDALAPLTAALGSKFADMRAVALRALPPLFATSPVVQSLVAAHLGDGDASVRRVALAQLVALHPAGAVEPLRIAFERGTADVRCEVLVRGILAGLVATGLSPIVVKALDDDDADVRRIAFVAQVLAHPPLVAWLEARDEPFGRALTDVVRRAAEAMGRATPVPGVDPDAAVVKSLGDVYAQFVHPKHGDVAIFRPKLHTPIKPGDSVHLVGVKREGSQTRATDYAVGEVATITDAELAAIRKTLTGSPGKAEPSEADREPLLAALACRTPDTALRGARGLALFGDMRALGALLTISREPDAGLRRAAAYALVALQDRRAERRLAWMTSDPDTAVRDAALTCYARLESDPLAVAAVALQSAHDDVRVRGLDLLVKQGRGNARAEELLAGALEDESSKVRGEAFRTLWSWHDADPLGPLDRALDARFPDLRLRAVQELAGMAKTTDGRLAGPARERVAKAIGDRDVSVARAAYEATLELEGRKHAPTFLAAIASSRPQLRARGANDAKKAQLEEVRSALTKLLEDSDAEVRIAAVEALDELVKDDLGPLYVGLQSSHLELRVRAAELLAPRRDEQIASPMRALVADKELLERMPALVAPLRRRAATALASLGTPKLLRYFATELIKDDDPIVREQAARGVSNATRRGEEGYLLDLLGHEEIAVRSWAGEGLARLGDARALPVLTGTLRHEHPPIRIGAVLSFAALGPEGYGGMLQGLEDPSRDVQRIVLSVILARDLRAFRKGEAPELLATALSSQRHEVRFAAARAIELRIQPEQYVAHLVAVLLPELPDKGEERDKWPDEANRARLMLGLAEALAGDRPEQRYAAAQALRLRDRPLEFFREVQRVVRPRSTSAPWVPETSPIAPPAREGAKKGPLGFLRRLFASGPEAAEDAAGAEPIATTVAPDEQKRLRLLAFGAYVGLLRQAAADDESHRVRRDAIERIVELATSGAVTVASATPALARALDDPNHLVRRAALAALRSMYAADPEAALSLALASSAPDVVRAALDELTTRGDAARPRIVRALDSPVADARKYAFELLEKGAPPGSLEPLLAALGSAHADIRIGVLERLATSQDPRVAAALGKALESDHEDLRLRAAELLASRRDDRAVDVLAASLRSDAAPVVQRATDALARIGSPAAIAALSARIDDVTDAARVALVHALGKTRGAEAIDALAARFDDDPAVRAAAVAACLAVVGPRSDTKALRGQPKPKSADQALALRFSTAAARCRHADVRLAAAARLDDVPDAAADALLVVLFADRDVAVRARAVASYAKRVELRGASPAPLEEVLRGGARETMLSAAEGLAHRGNAAAFRPLLLFVRAGEPDERPRALLGLGTLGDKRALAELELVAEGGSEEAPADEPMKAAALEALGRIFRRLGSDDAERVRDRIEAGVGDKSPPMAIAAVQALRHVGDGRARSRIEGIVASGAFDRERVAAAEALGKLADASSEQALARALDDRDGDVRAAARAALEALFPAERTRVELWAVESAHDDISEPAAAFLADEGDAGQLLAKLAKISDDALRVRLRYGLARRERIAGTDLAKLLAEGGARARADAAWVAGVRASAVAPGDRPALAQALVAAAATADARRREAHGRGKRVERDAEADALERALWAARRVAAKAPAELAALAKTILADATAPAGARVEAARALGGAAGDAGALTAALGDGNLRVRAEAASSLGAAPSAPGALATPAGAPADVVLLRRTAGARPLAADGFATSAGRVVFAPLAVGAGSLGPLLTLARTGKGADRLDAIAALGVSTATEALSLLAELSSKASREAEPVKKAAYRSLRRAQRAAARAAKSKEAQP